MDRSLNQFYINYRHPHIQEGTLLLGTVIVRNNFPEGFTLKLSSKNNGLISQANSFHSVRIPYSISVEKSTGVVGDGVTLTEVYKENQFNEFVLLTSTDQKSYTDIGLNIYIHIDQKISDRLLAGRYLDQIDVIYENASQM